MKMLGYINIGSNIQDIENQRNLLSKYAKKNKIIISKLLEIETFFKKNKKKIKIDFLLDQLKANDLLLVSEFSKLGSNMLETLSVINLITLKGVKIVFVKQPELSTNGPHSKLFLTICNYLAETEREYISIRTKKGLEAAKAKGKRLGRPKGSKNKKAKKLDPYKQKIKEYLEIGLSKRAVMQIVNNQLEIPIGYSTFSYYIENDEDLKKPKTNSIKKS